MIDVNSLLLLKDVPALKALARPCWPKRQHAERGEAETQLNDVLHNGMEKDVKLIHTYLCPDCGFWHVGHGRGGI